MAMKKCKQPVPSEQVVFSKNHKVIPLISYLCSPCHSTDNSLMNGVLLDSPNSRPCVGYADNRPPCGDCADTRRPCAETVNNLLYTDSLDNHPFVGNPFAGKTVLETRRIVFFPCESLLYKSHGSVCTTFGISIDGYLKKEKRAFSKKKSAKRPGQRHMASSKKLSLFLRAMLMLPKPSL